MDIFSQDQIIDSPSPSKILPAIQEVLWHGDGIMITLSMQIFEVIIQAHEKLLTLSTEMDHEE